MTCPYCDRIHDRPHYSEPVAYRFSGWDVAKFIVGIALLYLLVIALFIHGTVAK